MCLGGQTMCVCMQVSSKKPTKRCAYDYISYPNICSLSVDDVYGLVTIVTW